MGFEHNTGETNWQMLVDRYRECCEVPEGRNFMPVLWQKIEAKRMRTVRFERAARSLFAAAVGLSLVLGAFLMVPGQPPSVLNSATYVEEIATANTADGGTFFEPVRMELPVTEHHRR